MKIGDNEILGYVYQDSKGYLKLAEGLITERPNFISTSENYDRDKPFNGMMRYNSTEDVLEAYINKRWTPLISDRDFTKNTIPPDEDSRELTYETLGNVLSDLQRNITGNLELRATVTNTGVTSVPAYQAIRGSIGDPLQGLNAYSVYATYSPCVFIGIIDPFSVSGFPEEDRWDLKYTAWASLTRTYLNITWSYNSFGAMVYMRPLWEMDGYNQVDSENRLVNYGKFYIKIGLTEGLAKRSENVFVGIRWYCSMFRYTNYKIPDSIYVPPDPDFDVPDEITIDIKNNTSFDLNAYMSQRYPLWETNPNKCNITVNIFPNVLIHSVLNGPAFFVGTLPNNTNVTINNKGTISGIGGYGGEGGGSSIDYFPRRLDPPQNGFVGGDSMEIRGPVKFNNNGGVINSPAGGGGGTPALICIPYGTLRKRFIGGSAGGSGAYLQFGSNGGSVASSVDYDKTTRLRVDRVVLTSERFEQSGLEGSGSGETTGGAGRAIVLNFPSKTWTPNTDYKRSEVVFTNNSYYLCLADHTSGEGVNDVPNVLDLLYRKNLLSGAGGNITSTGGERGSDGLTMPQQRAHNGLVFYDNVTSSNNKITLNGVSVTIEVKDTIAETVDALCDYLNSSDRDDRIKVAYYDRYTYMLGSDITNVASGLSGETVEVIRITYKTRGEEGNNYRILIPDNVPCYPITTNYICMFNTNPPVGSTLNVNGVDITIGTTVPRGTTLGETLTNIEYYMMYINWVNNEEHVDWPIWNNDRRTNRIYTKYITYDGQDALGFEFNCVDLTTFDTKFKVVPSWEGVYTTYDISSLLGGSNRTTATGGNAGNAIKGISNITWVNDSGTTISGPNGSVTGPTV